MKVETDIITSITASLVWFMVFNTTFNNISVALWQYCQRDILQYQQTDHDAENYQCDAKHTMLPLRK
jgi:hypothetical protein